MPLTITLAPAIRTDKPLSGGIGCYQKLLRPFLYPDSGEHRLSSVFVWAEEGTPVRLVATDGHVLRVVPAELALFTLTPGEGESLEAYNGVPLPRHFFDQGARTLQVDHIEQAAKWKGTGHTLHITGSRFPATRRFPEERVTIDNERMPDIQKYVPEGAPRWTIDVSLSALKKALVSAGKHAIEIKQKAWEANEADRKKNHPEQPPAVRAFSGNVRLTLSKGKEEGSVSVSAQAGVPPALSPQEGEVVEGALLVPDPAGFTGRKLYIGVSSELFAKVIQSLGWKRARISFYGELEPVVFRHVPDVLEAQPTLAHEVALAMPMRL